MANSGERVQTAETTQIAYQKGFSGCQRMSTNSGVTETPSAKLAMRNRFPDLFAQAIEKSIPCIFVIEQDFDQFSPDKDRWAVIKLPDLFDESGEPDARLSESFAREFTRVVNAEESIFDFLYNAQIDKNRDSLLESFQLKPGIFGFGIDLKKWLKLSMPHVRQ